MNHRPRLMWLIATLALLVSLLPTGAQAAGGPPTAGFQALQGGAAADLTLPADANRRQPIHWASLA